MFNLKLLKASMPRETFELFSEGLMALEEIKKWTLVGGTALAIHYQHRLSEDLDFFIKNSTLEQERKRIDKIIQKLEDNGFEAVKLFENEQQIDFEINGVKVTFFASTLNILQKDVLQIGSISVASIETIKAMKMDAILNYRTLSRDFFDIATIMSKEKLTIFDLLESYQRYFNKKLSSSLIMERLILKEFDVTDPGLSSMLPKSKINLVSFRNGLKKEIIKQAQKETKSINTIINNPSIIKKYLTRKFGLTRMNLPQKLASIGEDELVLKALKIGDFDITYKDISGTTLLDYYLEDNKMFSKVLKFAKNIPDEWLQSRKFKTHSKDKLIALENSIIACAKIEQNSDEKIKRVSDKHNIDSKDLIMRIKEKKELLKIDYKLSNKL